MALLFYINKEVILFYITYYVKGHIVSEVAFELIYREFTND